MAVFGNGSGGALNVATGTTNLPLDTLHQYTTVNVASGATLSTASTTGSVLYILATQSIVIDGTINLFNIVNTGNNTWTATVNGELFSSPSVANGGAGSGARNGSSGGAQGNGYGGGGAGGGSANASTAKGGNGGTGGTPGGNGGAAKSATADSSGYNAVQVNGNNGGTSAGGGGGITSYYLTETGVAGANSYGANGAAAVETQNKSAGGGGGSGGLAGRPGVHLVLKAPSITLNGTLITSGSGGGKGGNGGTTAYTTSGGGGAGGGGGGHAGNIYITYSSVYSTQDNVQKNGGLGGGQGTSTGNTYNGAAGTAGTSGTLTVAVNLPPTTALTTPADNFQTTVDTPALSFTGTDGESENVDYQIQVSTVNTFASTIVDAVSETDIGFSGTSPYTSGVETTYTLQTPLTSGGVTYYWRARSKDPLGSNTYGAWSSSRIIISKPDPATVTSGASSAISVTSATLGGEVTNTGGGTLTERGFVYGTVTDPTILDSKSTVGGQLGNMSATITGLAEGTNYFWRSFATNSTNTAYGTTETFTTLPDAPLVASIYNITFDSASIDSTIDDNGSTVTERGIVYSLNPTPTLSDTKITSGSGAGVFTVNLTGLTALTTYYVRSYGTNSQGTSYSQEVNFSTSQTPGPPTVITGAVTNIDETTADVIGSEVTLNGTQPVTERGIVFSSVETLPTILDDRVTAPTIGLGTFNSNMTGLQPETDYYVRAYATSSLGTGYGAVQTFSTISLFIADQGDGYWTWTPDANNAVIGRSQATLGYSSVNLLLSRLNLENGETYTLHYSGHEFDNGEAYMVLQWYDNLVKTQQVITPNQPYTFVYDTSKLSWVIRLFVTGANTESNNINAVFEDIYLAKESTFSGFVPFIRKGITEIKLENNWILDKRREDTISSIFDAIADIGWSPFNAQTVGLGWLEVGDMLTINGDTSNKVVPWNTKLTIDGGIKEFLLSEKPDASETDYKKAGQITKSLKRTQISVDKNEQVIESIVEDVYSVDGILNTRFSLIEQDLDSVTTTVQTSGGINLIKNSVMYAFDSEASITLSNLALGKSVTTSGISTGAAPNVVTDGDTTTTNIVSVDDASEAYAEVDLGDIYEISSVKVWHDYSDGRTYTTPRTEVSEDGTTWFIVSQPTAYAETSNGNTRNLTPVNARYIRDYTNSNSVDTSNSWIEMEVYGVAQYIPNWIISGPGEIIIQASPESVSAGGISGNQFSLSDKTVTQTVGVRKDVDFIAADDKIYYSLSAKVRKNTVGDAFIRLTNRNETLTITLPNQTEYYWETVSIENILPTDDHFNVEIYSDSDAYLQVTDIILAPSDTKREWAQANGETMNTSLAVTDDGVTIRSSQFRNDYTRITALGFEVRKHEAGGERVFGFNGDETNVSKLRADNELSMTPLKVVPVNYASRKGWAFTRTEEE